MTPADLRYLDPATLSGEMQTRDILANIGTPSSVIDWVVDFVREQNEQTRALEKELHRALMDLEQ